MHCEPDNRDSVRWSLRAIAMQYQAQLFGAHGFDHIERVVANAQYLADFYPEIDAGALEAAAWLHDIGRGVEREHGVSHAEVSAALADDLLPPLVFTPARITLIREAIADHRFSTGRSPATMEGKLLQDADRLDALGAVGIARTFSEGHNRALYHAQSPFGDGRTLDDARYTLDHFYTKLLSLPATMHTSEAREIAGRRVEYMQGFLREFADELAMPIA